MPEKHPGTENLDNLTGSEKKLPEKGPKSKTLKKALIGITTALSLALTTPAFAESKPKPTADAKVKAARMLDNLDKIQPNPNLPSVAQQNISLREAARIMIYQTAAEIKNKSRTHLLPEEIKETLELIYQQIENRFDQNKDGEMSFKELQEMRGFFKKSAVNKELFNMLMEKNII